MKYERLTAPDMEFFEAFAMSETENEKIMITLIKRLWELENKIERGELVEVKK